MPCSTFPQLFQYPSGLTSSEPIQIDFIIITACITKLGWLKVKRLSQRFGILIVATDDLLLAALSGKLTTKLSVGRFKLHSIKTLFL